MANPAKVFMCFRYFKPLERIAPASSTDLATRSGTLAKRILISIPAGVFSTVFRMLLFHPFLGQGTSTDQLFQSGVAFGCPQTFVMASRAAWIQSEAPNAYQVILATSGQNEVLASLWYQEKKWRNVSEGKAYMLPKVQTRAKDVLCSATLRSDSEMHIRPCRWTLWGSSVLPLW